MDPARSESAHQAVPIGPVALIIKSTPTAITIETRRGQPGKNATPAEILTFKLDGTETSAPGSGATPIKCRAHWEDGKLVLGTTRNIQESTITTLQVYSVEAGGRELTVHKTLTVEHGYQFEGAKSSGSGTDVFVKTTSSKY